MQQGACLVWRHVRQQYLANRRAVQRLAPANARLHAQAEIGIDFVDVDDGVFIERAQVDGLARQLTQGAHFLVCFVHQIGVLQNLAAQSKQAQGSAVQLRIAVLRHIAQRLEGLQQAMHRRFGQRQLLRNRGHTDIALVAQAFENGERLLHRGYGIGLVQRCAGFAHRAVLWLG